MTITSSDELFQAQADDIPKEEEAFPFIGNDSSSAINVLINKSIKTGQKLENSKSSFAKDFYRKKLKKNNNKIADVIILAQQLKGNTR